MLTGPGSDPELVRLLEPVFAALRSQAAGTATGADRAVLTGTGIRRLGGGRNNPIFGGTLARQAVCVKLHRTDGRQRDRREWEALDLLARQGVSIAPKPLGYDPGQQPVMAMAGLPGEGLGQRCLSSEQIRALADAIRRLHAITPNGDDPRLLPVRLTDHAMQTQVSEFFAHKADDTTPLRKELRTGWTHWTSGSDPSVLAEPTPTVFGQGDPNLTNCLWDPDQLWLIDFEYAGWSNQPYELALLIEHVQSRHTPDTSWRVLLDQSNLSAWGHRRTLAARRLVAWFWAKTFWPTTNTDDTRFNRQARRVKQVVNEPPL